MNKVKYEETEELHTCVDSAMGRLILIWDEIGIYGDPRTARKGVVFLHVRNLLDEMVHEEELLKNRLADNVEKFGTEMSKLCRELGLPTHKPQENLTLLQLEKEMRSKVDSLTKEKTERLTRLKQLKTVEEQLCAKLSMTPHYIAPGSVPSNQQLAELEEHIRGLETEQVRRQKQITAMQERIIKMLEELELSPNTSFERNVVCDLEMVPLSTDNLKAAKCYHDELELVMSENKDLVTDLWSKVKAIWEKLNLSEEHRANFEDLHRGCSFRTVVALKEELVLCDRLKLQNLEQIVVATRRELLLWWDRCFVLPDIRAAFSPLHEEVMSEELLLLHEREIEAMKEYYRQNQDILTEIARHQQLWKELLDLEHRANPDRFSNRGGNLLKEERIRKKLAVELPKIEREVLSQIRNWERMTGSQFLICGMQFEEFVKKQREDFLAEKENERQQRHQQKVRQLEEELLYGSKPITPGTKRFAGCTPNKTPLNKCRKVETTSKVTLTIKSRFSPAAGPTPRTREKPLPRAVSSSSIGGNRLSEQNRTISCQDLNNGGDPTVVMASSCGLANSDPDISSLSLISVGPYDEFANGLNRTAKSNVRSTLLPKAAYF